jgi:hypothetical protein
MTRDIQLWRYSRAGARERSGVIDGLDIYFIY